MSKKVIVPLAEGFEEIEALSIVDILRRAGIEVVMAGLESLHVKGAERFAPLFTRWLELLAVV